jgi:succinate semialdehyde reductase (NADPH)
MASRSRCGSGVQPIDISCQSTNGARPLVQLMKAAVLSAAGKPVEIEEIPVPRPQRGEILIKVEACGVCHTDLHVMKGDVGFPMPAVLGHEVAGEVAALGEGVGGLTVGDKVITSFIMPCGTCRFCAAGRDDVCETFFAMNRLNGTLYDGTSRLQRQDGSTLAMYSMAGLAEYAVTPATAAFRRDPTTPAAEAAILGCAFFTAYGAVRHRAGLVTGETVVVLGAGGVGTAIIQMAAAFGASRVIAVDLADDKLELARANGASDVVNGSKMNAVEAVRGLTDGVGVDVAFEAIGAPATWVQGTEMLSDGGRFVAVGIAGKGVTAPIEITRIVRRSISVIGSYGARVRTDMPQVAKLAALGRIDPGKAITQTYRLEETAEAYSALEHAQIRGRAVIVL